MPESSAQERGPLDADEWEAIRRHRELGAWLVRQASPDVAGTAVAVVADLAAPVVAVPVHDDVGFRCVPHGSTGFAHLFEHLMFQGSERLPKGELPRPARPRRAGVGNR